MNAGRVSRRTIVLGAAAVGLAGCARPPIVITSPTATPGGSVREKLAATMSVYQKNTPKLGIAIKDLRTGATFDANGDYSSQSASMAKVMIVAMALKKARADATPLTFKQATQVSEALINSDNDSADALWEFAGGPDAYQRLANELEMPNTRKDAKNTFWSWTWTTPKDQLILLDRLRTGTPALSEQDRLYELDVMRRTNPSQQWGVGNIGDATGVERQMKNGWVQFKSSDGLWAVNSLGIIEDDTRHYEACLMCRTPTFEGGRQLLDAIGGTIFEVMGTGKLT